MAATVSQSRRELALRLALGASGADVMRLVVAKGLALTAAGVAVGGVVAYQSTRLLGYLLYEVSPHDPRAFAIAVAAVIAAAVVACLVPAWRATRTDPIQALRG
jgi:ABC-type antimicrobial peptide transport system permease subunit